MKITAEFQPVHVVLFAVGRLAPTPIMCSQVSYIFLPTLGTIGHSKHRSLQEFAELESVHMTNKATGVKPCTGDGGGMDECFVHCW